MAGKPGWFRGIPSSKGREVFSGFNISNVYSLIFSLLFIWVREIKIQKVSLALPFFPASGVTSTGLIAYTNQSKYRQIEGLSLHNLFTRSINSSQMAAAAYLTIFEA